MEKQFIDDKLWFDNLSNREFKLLIYLYQRANKNHCITISQNKLSIELDISVRAIKKLLQTLEQKDFLKITRCDNESSMYKITEKVTSRLRFI